MADNSSGTEEVEVVKTPWMSPENDNSLRLNNNAEVVVNPTATVHTSAKIIPKPTRPDAHDNERQKTDVADLRPCTACCCVISSLYCSFPDCVGCSGEYMCCCLSTTFKICKPSKSSSDCCIINENNCLCIYPTTLCMGQSQCFFVDSRCALPCNDEVPCVVAMFCFTLCYRGNWSGKCCTTLGAIDPNLSHNTTLLQAATDSGKK